MKVRLDRAVATPAWRDNFESPVVRHLVSPVSDHVALHVNCARMEDVRIKKKIRQYEVMWERDPALQEIIARAWEAAGQKTSLGDVHAALRSTMSKLFEWSRVKFGSIKNELEKSRSQLEELMLMNADRCEIRKVTDKMNELLYREELMWLQRSRIDWLKAGDRNTKIFHAKSVWRARKNRVKKLEDAQGVVHTGIKEMGKAVTDYFEELFTADPSLDQAQVTDLFEAVVTQQINDVLCAEFSDKEIGDALFQIGPLKASGPDGFPARFFSVTGGQ